MRERTYQEVVTTRETTLWGKVAAQPTEKLTTWLKLAHSWRDNSVYGTSVWFGYAENPLLRKFYLADRRRNSHRGAARLRDQREDLARPLGRLCRRRLQRFHGRPRLGAQRQCRRRALGGLHRTDPGPRVLPDPAIRSQQNGSEAFAGARLDRPHEGQVRRARHRRQAPAIPNKFDIGADFTVSRSRSEVAVDNVLAAPPFPTREDQPRDLQAVRHLLPEGQPLDHRQLPVRALRLAGLAARRHRPGDRSQPARARRAAAELFV